MYYTEIIQQQPTITITIMAQPTTMAVAMMIYPHKTQEI
jgi:hypothetical protein